MINRLLVAFVISISVSSALQAKIIFVASEGNDRDSLVGSSKRPFATIQGALRYARNLRRIHDTAVKYGVVIVVRDGSYLQDEPLFIRPEDGGTATSITEIRAAKGAHPIISGGVQLNGWKPLQENIPGLPATAKDKIWVADAPWISGQLLRFRQLYVNGKKATRARITNKDDDMPRILSVDKPNREIWIPAPLVKLLPETGQMEMMIHQMWAIANLRIKSIEIVGDKARLKFQQPESRVQFEHPWPCAVIDNDHKLNGNSAFNLNNAIEFLDEPGEWYEDLKTGKVYYYPKAGESITTIEIIAPGQEKLLEIKGIMDYPVAYITIKGLSFQYATWLRPSDKGHVPHQAGMYMIDAYKLKVPGTANNKGLENQAWLGRPPGAVEVSYANHIRFEGCTFTHLASSGLDFVKATHDDEVTGNLFTDIGGTGIQVGTYAEEGIETHVPFNPTDEREICTSEHIANNLVTDVTNEDWGCVGIGAGYVKGINIEHNEISEVSYTGISLGWGWNKKVNVMRNNHVYANYIHHYAKHMYDVAGIYTLSAQPGTVVNENRVEAIYHPPYAHDTKHWFYLYSDEGSAYMSVKDNWCPEEKFLRNANGPNSIWENNGPMVKDSIKNAAGILPEYRTKLKM